MSELDSPVQQFNSDISRAKNLLKLVKVIRAFGASNIPAEVTNQEISWPSASELFDMSRRVRTDMPLLSGSLLLYCSGRFEYLFKNLVEYSADQIFEYFESYDSLPIKLKSSIYKYSLEVAANNNKYGYDEAQVRNIISILADNFDANSEFQRSNSDCLSVTTANLKSEVVQELLGRLDYKSFWGDLGKQIRTKQFFDTQEDKETSDAAKSLLNEIMDERNSIAHPTDSTEFPDPDKVIRYIDFLELIGQNAKDFLELHIRQYRSS